MKRNVYRSPLFYSWVMLLSLPACIQAFPINGLLVAGSMTFTTYTVTIMGTTPNPANAYSPDTLTIQSGDTVIWAFGNGTHSSTCGCNSPCGLWDTGANGAGFSTPVPYTSFAIGTNGYYCEVHGCDAMYGAVIRTRPPTSVPSKYWEKLSAIEKQPDTKTHPIQNFFGLTFVSPGNPTAVKPDSTGNPQSVTENTKINGSTGMQVSMTR